VQNQIDSQESDLESMLAQQDALNHETADATVTLTLVGPKAAAKPPAKSAPPPGLARGLAGGWHALRLTVGWLLTILGAVAPFVAAVAVVGGLAWWGQPPAHPAAAGAGRLSSRRAPYASEETSSAGDLRRPV